MYSDPAISEPAGAMLDAARPPAVGQLEHPWSSRRSYNPWPSDRSNHPAGIYDQLRDKVSVTDRENIRPFRGVAIEAKASLLPNSQK
jgi:hypothetical protein